MAEPVEVLSPGDDARNDVAAAIKQLKGGADEAVEVEAVEEPPEVVADNASPPTNDDHPTDPARYADGKFKPTKTEAAPVTAAPVVTPSKDTAKASTEQPSTAAAAPPAGWTAAEKAEWSKLSPVAQAAVSRREAEISSGGKQWSEEKRRYEAAIGPISQLAKSRGLDVSQASQLLATAQNMLDRNPAEGLRRIAASYGVDLASLASNQPAPQTQTVDPVAPLYQHVSTLEGRLNQLLETQTLGVVNSFSQANPHYASVENDLMQIIPQIQQANPGLPPAEVLQKAYEQAIWLNPDVRAKMIEEQRTQADTTRVAALRTKEASARKAAVSVKGSSNGAMPSPKVESSGDVYEDVRNAIHQLRQ